MISRLFGSEVADDRKLEGAALRGFDNAQDPYDEQGDASNDVDEPAQNRNDRDYVQA